MKKYALKLTPISGRAILIILGTFLGAGCGTEDQLNIDISPDQFSIPEVNNVDPSSWIELGPFAITGINGKANVVFPKGEVRIGPNQNYTTKQTTITNNQELHYRIKSSPQSEGIESSWIRVGNLLNKVKVTTKDLDLDNDGIYDDDVKDEPTFKQVAKSMVQFLEGCDLAGFNILKFDV